MGTGPTPDEVNRALAAYLMGGKNRKKGEKALLASGMPPERVTASMAEAINLRRAANRTVGGNRLLYGMLMLGAAVGLYFLSSGERLFIGLFAAGGIYSMVGLLQCLTGGEAG
jgi:hypothetical protein